MKLFNMDLEVSEALFLSLHTHLQYFLVLSIHFYVLIIQENLIYVDKIFKLLFRKLKKEQITKGYSDINFVCHFVYYVGKKINLTKIHRICFSQCNIVLSFPILAEIINTKSQVLNIES